MAVKDNHGDGWFAGASSDAAHIAVFLHYTHRCLCGGQLGLAGSFLPGTRMIEKSVHGMCVF